ncbi:response regulator [Paenibacillus sp. YN15]|uniref:response regulator n=1 Tax=Paenibacillus sp. YN15 TaxID=1742774 RepID=UPI000DCD5FF4|nr:response regulator [Paenibacillus sp. YN15]RAV05607.1 AraC family transcriptional regulator [Paenibacillus sp. YN15]
MITALLADDEPIIIKGLKKLIPWEKHGIRVIGEAWTGRGLLELMEKEEPDLIITDISMPDGSGIDVLKEIGRRGLKTKVIFISAYQEFSYAKDALALGAVDYLVKPIEKGLLLAAVERAIAALEEESEGLRSKSKLAVYEHKDRKTQLEELFDRLLDGDIRREEAEDKLRSLDAGCIHDAYTVLLLESELPAEDTRWGEHEKRLLLFAVGNMAEELVRREGAGIVVRKGDRLCAVVNHPQGTSLTALARDMIRNAAKYLKVNLSVGIGREYTGPEGIKASFRTAAEALSRIFFASEGGGAVLWDGEDADKNGVSEREMTDARQETLQGFLTKDQERLEAGLDILFERTERYAGGSKDKAVMAGYATIVEWVEKLEGFGVSLEQGEAEMQRHLNAMRNARRYEELKGYIRHIAEQIIRRMESAGSGKEAQQLVTVKTYIENHYMENITLEGVASKIYMNPYYFSSFFKKHTHMNFKQYLTEIRMKEAVKLLLQTDLMVYEIAERVGYNNSRQFSDMFKKHFGKLPQEYKAQGGPKA